MKKILQVTALLVSLTSVAFAQNNIKGVIKDDSGSSIPGATVSIKGTTTYTVSDVNGEFAIKPAKEFPFSLLINLVGFKTQEIEVYELTDEAFEVNLKTDNLLDEVVVVGYGTQERKDVIGSITKVNPAEIKTIQAGSFDAQLQGKVSGVQISSNTGVPGESVNIRVRGATSINAD